MIQNSRFLFSAGPVTPLLLGTGFCRGPKWTFQKWPIPKGRLTLEDCAEECAKKKGCTAFDVSEQQKDKFDCLLYGHKGVVPATGVSKLPAKCYVLKGSPLSKLLDEEDIAATNGESVTLDDEEDDDQDEGTEKLSIKLSLVSKNMHVAMMKVTIINFSCFKILKRLVLRCLEKVCVGVQNGKVENGLNQKD